MGPISNLSSGIASKNVKETSEKKQIQKLGNAETVNKEDSRKEALPRSNSFKSNSKIK